MSIPVIGQARDFRASAWRAWDRETLDAAYNNAAAVAGSAECVVDWERRSEKARSRADARLDLRYGPAPRQTIDFIPAGPGAPTLVFFHGGYWQSRSKHTFTFLADGLVPNGISLALVGYTLAPEATLDQIAAESRSALDFLVRTVPSLGASSDGLRLAGWSAGAQLAAMVLDHRAVRAAFLASGVYDLEPIRHTYLNEKLAMDEACALRNSPLHHVPAAGPPTWVVAGGAELPELRRQSAELAAAHTRAGLACTHWEEPGADHFSILERLADPAGSLARRMASALMRA
ncbi:MAG: alpha/beta hydrolase [Ramlibacter sp.]|jgi:arylformamidase|nr:alpha/beta hydrolase [Ramlibacter sp.]